MGDLLKEIRARILAIRQELEDIRVALPEEDRGTLAYINQAIEALTYASATTYEAWRELTRNTMDTQRACDLLASSVV